MRTSCPSQLQVTLTPTPTLTLALALTLTSCSIALQRAKTAREAIALIDQLTTEHGYASTGESLVRYLVITPRLRVHRREPGTLPSYHP